MRDGFAASMRDPAIISVRSELGLVDTRILDLVSSLAREQYTDSWKKDLEESLVRLRQDLSDEEVDAGAALEAIDNAEAALAQRDSDHKAWGEILGTIETRRKLVDTERRLLEAHQASVDVNQMKAILLHILTSVRDHVLPLDGGKRAVNEISTDIRQLLLPRPDRARAIPVDDEGVIIQ
jgi:hypothetical protein